MLEHSAKPVKLAAKRHFLSVLFPDLDLHYLSENKKKGIKNNDIKEIRRAKI